MACMHICDIQKVLLINTQVGMPHNWTGRFAVVTQLAKHMPPEVCHPSLPVPAHKPMDLSVKQTKLDSIDLNDSHNANLMPCFTRLTSRLSAS